MTVKEIIASTFETTDGKKFLDRMEANNWQKKIEEFERIYEQLVIYKISHNFEATEGRGYRESSFIVVNAEQYTDIDVSDWCYLSFGAPYSPWYHTSVYKNWILTRTPIYTKPNELQAKKVMAFLSKVSIPNKEEFLVKNINIEQAWANHLHKLDIPKKS